MKEEGGWDEDLIQDVFINRDMDLILSIPLRMEAGVDAWFWKHEKRGRYTVKSGYRVLTSNVQESAHHLFVKCPLAVNVWRSAQCGYFDCNAANFASWWDQFLRAHNMEDSNVAAMILWSLWNARNDLTWNGNRHSQQAILASSMSVLSQWRNAKVQPVRCNSIDQVVSSSVWVKPPIGWVKCNIDAALFPNLNHIGFGCVLRDSNGCLMAAKNGLLRGPLDPAVAEALACKEALSWIKSLQISNVLVEMVDCLVL